MALEEDDNYDDVELLPKGVIRKQPENKDSSIKAKYLVAFIVALLIIGSLWHILFSFSSPPVHENYFVGVQTCEGKSWKLDSSGSWQSSQYVHIPCAKISGEPSDMRNNGPIVRVDSYHIGEEGVIHWPWSEGNCGGLANKAGSDKTMAENFAGEIARLKKIGVHGGISIDIGAFNGDTTATIGFVSDRVIVFEPNTMVYPYVADLAKLNPHLNIDPWNFGISPKPGTLTFQYGHNFCNGGVSGDGLGDGKGQKITFHTVNLLSFLGEHYPASMVKEIGFIKMDAEGFDSTILASIIPLIEKICETKCPIVQVEWFNLYREKENDRGSVKLFESFKLLPGKWDVKCTNVCNARVVCADFEMKTIVGPNDPSRGPCDDLVLIHKESIVQ